MLHKKDKKTNKQTKKERNINIQPTHITNTTIIPSVNVFCKLIIGGSLLTAPKIIISNDCAPNKLSLSNSGANAKTAEFKVIVSFSVMLESESKYMIKSYPLWLMSPTAHEAPSPNISSVPSSLNKLLQVTGDTIAYGNNSMIPFK